MSQKNKQNKKIKLLILFCMNETVGRFKQNLIKIHEQTSLCTQILDEVKKNLTNQACHSGHSRGVVDKSCDIYEFNG